MRIAIITFLSIVAVLFSFYRYSDHRDLNNYWKGAPNATHHCVQTDPAEMLREPKFKAQIAAINSEAPAITISSSEHIANSALH